MFAGSAGEGDRLDDGLEERDVFLDAEEAGLEETIIVLHVDLASLEDTAFASGVEEVANEKTRLGRVFLLRAG